VGEVHDAHDPEDQGQTDAEQRVRTAENDGVDEVLEELIHGGTGTQAFGTTTLPFSMRTRYTLQMLWPLSLPAGPTLPNLIFPPRPVSSMFQNASRIAPASGLPALAIAAAMVRMPS
jgi:hypothetical protein